MSENYTNNNILEFTEADLPINLTKPTDGNLFFYGWYYNNDTSKEITQITTHLDGVGYGDIELSGYFSTVIMTSVSFDANGHPDYFTDLASYNCVVSSPSEVQIPTSIYDDDINALYYLKGWALEDGTMFDNSMESFTGDSVILKAVWGTKLKVNYYYNFYGSSGNYILSTIHYYPGKKGQIRSLADTPGDQQQIYSSDNTSYTLYSSVNKWQKDNSSTYYTPKSIVEFDSSYEGQIINLYPGYDELATYYKVTFTNTAKYTKYTGSVSMAVSFGNVSNHPVSKDNPYTEYILEGSIITINIGESYNIWPYHNTILTLLDNNTKSTDYNSRTVSCTVDRSGTISLVDE